MQHDKHWVMVDVDSTLYDFTTPEFMALKTVNPDIPNPAQIAEWNWYKPYFTDDQYFEAVNYVHLHQAEFPPFEGAKELLETLLKRYNVMIATHRLPTYSAELRDWLEKYELPCTDIYCDTKTKLGCFEYAWYEYIIDDCPATLLRAPHHGVRGLSIRYPWNKHLDGERSIYLFDNLIEINQFFKGKA